MKVTDVRIFKIENPKGRVKAFASITLDDSFVIHGLQVVEGKERAFVSMPSRKNKSGEFVNIVHPITNDLRKEIEENILKAL